MAPRRSERKGEPKGRHHLAAAPIDTETQIGCPTCGVKLAVAEGTGTLAGVRVLKCQRLGCRHQEELPAAVAVAAMGGQALPGLEGSGDDQRESDLVAAETAAGEAQAGAPTPASADAGADDGSVRKGRAGGKRGSRADRQRRLMDRAGEGATVAEDPSFGAAEVEALDLSPIASLADHELGRHDPPTVGGCALCDLEQARIGYAVMGAAPPQREGKPLWVTLGGGVQPQGSEPDVRLLPLSDVAPHALNPRKSFDEEALAELAGSIREHGILQPIVVRSAGEVPGGVARWWIVAGERRWRAARLAGESHIPCIVREVDDAAHLKLALLENLARKDLDAVEEARGYQQLVSVVGMKQAEIAASVGRAPSSVANALRLLDLPAEVLDLIQAGRLSASHGKALMAEKWRPWPKVQAAIAGFAADKGTPSRTLETSALPFVSELTSTRLIAEIKSWNAGFDTGVCNACPFGAMVREGYSAYCLKPTHMAQLKREAKGQTAQLAERQKEAAQQVAEGAAAAGADGQPSAEGGRVDLTAGKDGADYVQLYHGERQAGCAGCERAVQARVSSYGGLSYDAEVCLDVAGHKAAKQAERDTREAAIARETAAAVAVLDRHLAMMTVEDSRALAVLVAGLIVGIDLYRREHVPALVQAGWPAVAAAIPTEWHPDAGPAVRLAEALAELSAGELVALAVRALLQPAIGDVVRSREVGRGEHGLLRWYLPEIFAGAASVLGDSAARRADQVREALRAILPVDLVEAFSSGELSFPFVADFECSGCEGDVLVNSREELDRLAEDLADGEEAGETVNVFCDDCTPRRGEVPEREATSEERAARADALAERVAGRAEGLSRSLVSSGLAAGE